MKKSGSATSASAPPATCPCPPPRSSSCNWRLTYMRRPLISYLLLTFAAGATTATDWPQFRGPAGDGHAQAKNLPTTWNESTNVAWKTEIPGKGWSSPSLVKDRLYLTTAIPADPEKPNGLLSLRTLCVDAITGKLLWD